MANIRLNKQNKTIKVVNRKDTLRLKQEQHEINVKHSGKIGPTGPMGPMPIYVGDDLPASHLPLWVDTDTSSYADVLSTDDIHESLTRRFFSDVDQERLRYTEGTNTGDQQLTITGTVVTITGDNGSSIQLPAAATGGVTTIGQLTDVDVATAQPTDGQALIYNATSNKWHPGTVATGGTGGQVGNIDGGTPSTSYGGITIIDGGTV